MLAIFESVQIPAAGNQLQTTRLGHCLVIAPLDERVVTTRTRLTVCPGAFIV